MSSLIQNPMQEPGEFTAHLTAAHALHKADQRRIAQLEQRIQALEAELTALKHGDGISIIIAGQRFDLAPDEPLLPTQALGNAEWLNDRPPTNRFEGSVDTIFPPEAPAA